MYRLFLFFCCAYIIKASPVEDVKRLRHPRMIGGNPFEIKDAPYQVSIINVIGGIPIAHTCGGSIISKNYVLTVGHCLIRRPGAYAYTYAVKSGTTSWGSDGKMHNVVDVIMHESFAHTNEILLANATDSGEIIHDIALLKVTPDFELDGNKEKIVELADKDGGAKVGDDAFIMGWGYSAEKYIALTLNGLNVTIIDCEDSNEFYKPQRIADFYICAKHPSGDKDFCDGDSGGPLMVKGKQVGIISFSLPGCIIGSGVYVDVAKHRDWIDEHMKAESHRRWFNLDFVS